MTSTSPLLHAMREVLASSADPVPELIAAVVPVFAEWCIVDMRGSASARARNDEPVADRVLVAHANERRASMLRQTVAALSPDEHLLDVSRDAWWERRLTSSNGRRSTLSALAERPEPSVAASGSDSPTVADDAWSSIVAAPLVSRGTLLGVLTLGRSRVEFEPAELGVVEEVASKIATAIDLAQEATEVSRANESRDDMIAVLAHDLRTPLSTLSMVTARLRKNPAVVEATTNETQVLSRGVNRIEGILRSLVDCSRLASGKLRLQFEKLDLAPIVAAAVEAARPVAGKRVLDFDQPEGTFEVIGDRGRLRQVLDQLISNGLKYTPDTGAILARISRVGSEIVVSVSDTGVGIAADKLELIFVPSWRVAKEHRVSGQGPRMGLFVSRGLVEAHGGRLWVESMLDHGTTFSFSVPRVDAERDATGMKGSVLVIDDDQMFRDEVSDVLRAEGFSVTRAPRGRAALDYLRTHARPCLILLDLGAPVTDGWELYRELKSDPKLSDIPIVIVSGARVKVAGADGEHVECEVLEKPLRPERLIALAEHHLAS